MNLEQRLEQLKQLSFPELTKQPDVVIVETTPIGNKGIKRAIYVVPKEAIAFLDGMVWMPDTEDGHWESAALVGIF